MVMDSTVSKIADLIEFDKNGVGDTFPDSFRQPHGIGAEQIVADGWTLPSCSVIMRHPSQSSTSPSSMEMMGYFEIHDS